MKNPEVKYFNYLCILCKLICLHMYAFNFYILNPSIIKNCIKITDNRFFKKIYACYYSPVFHKNGNQNCTMRHSTYIYKTRVKPHIIFKIGSFKNEFSIVTNLYPGSHFLYCTAGNNYCGPRMVINPVC